MFVSVVVTTTNVTFTKLVAGPGFCWQLVAGVFETCDACNPFLVCEKSWLEVFWLRPPPVTVMQFAPQVPLNSQPLTRGTLHTLFATSYQPQA